MNVKPKKYNIDVHMRIEEEVYKSFQEAIKPDNFSSVIRSFMKKTIEEKDNELQKLQEDILNKGFNEGYEAGSWI